MSFLMAEQDPDSPLLTACVLIVTHNSIGALRPCLEAVERSEDRASIEVLVVDNGSTDGSASIDSDFPEVTVLRLPRHFGLTKARNIGIRTAKAEHLLLLSPDVLVEPGTISGLVAALGAEPSALAVCPLLVDAADNPVSRTFRLPPPDAVKSQWREPYCPAPADRTP
jgi:GT2 family glycosyltransferase